MSKISLSGTIGDTLEIQCKQCGKKFWIAIIDIPQATQSACPICGQWKFMIEPGETTRLQSWKKFVPDPTHTLDKHDLPDGPVRRNK